MQLLVSFTDGGYEFNHNQQEQCIGKTCFLLSSYLPSRRSVWETDLDGGRKYRPNTVRSVQTTEVKTELLARLIRCLLCGKNKNNLFVYCNWFVLTDILLANGDEPK